MDAWDTGFIWAFPLWPGTFSPTQPSAEETGGATGEEDGEHVRPLPKWGRDHLLIRFLGRRRRRKKERRESPSAAMGCEREVCCYRRAGSRGLTLQQEADLQPGTGTIYQRSVTRRDHARTPRAQVDQKNLRRRDDSECVATCSRWFVFSIPLMLCQARSNFVLQFNFKSISWRFLEKNNAKEDKTWLFETAYASAFRVQ